MKKEVVNKMGIIDEVHREAREWVLYTVAAILFVIAVGIVAFIIQGQDFFLYRFFAPKYEQTRRETFEQSKAFRQGNVQEIQQMAFEYTAAPENKKSALASIILHRVADIDTSTLPVDLQNFINKLRSERLGNNQ